MEQKTFDEVLAMIDREKAATAVAHCVVYLGGLLDWGVDEFMAVQETLFTALPEGLPSVGDQDDAALKFWGTISNEVGNDCDYEPPQYVATINTPGYLSTDDDPPTFDTTREAWEYLSSERRDSEEFDRDENVTEDMASATLNTLHQFAIEGAGVGSVVGPTPGYDGDHDLGLAYSVSEVKR